MVCFDYCFRAGSEKKAQRWRQKGTVRKPKYNFMIIQASKKTECKESILDTKLSMQISKKFMKFRDSIQNTKQAKH